LVIKMADVIVAFKVMPTGTDVNIDELEKKIKEVAKPTSIKRQPIAFGIVALIVTKIIPDAGGELDKAENLLRSLEGVGEVEVEEVSRAL
jgi:elongation factor 1-beta